jgi:1,4-dihydroxy-2-naphthoyl-CoA hydrolase
MLFAFKYKPSLEELDARSVHTLAGHLGLKFVELGDDYIKASMPVDTRTVQPMGILHGGASAALAETLGSIASVLCIDQPNQYPVGLEINVNHLKMVSGGQVTGIVRPIRVGKTVHVWNIEIFSDNNELTAVSRLTVMIINR